MLFNGNNNSQHGGSGSSSPVVLGIRTSKSAPGEGNSGPSKQNPTNPHLPHEPSNDRNGDQNAGVFVNIILTLIVVITLFFNLSQFVASLV